MTDNADTIERAYRVRLRLNATQRRTLLRLFGARRAIWNWAIAMQHEARDTGGPILNAAALSREFTALKQTPEHMWLAELPRVPFHQTFRDLDSAWANWRRGDAKPPRSKRFGTVRSARFVLDQRRDLVDRAHGTVQIYGIGRVRFRVTEPMVGRLRSVTINVDAAGRWFASFTADQVPRPVATPATTPVLGIDLGLKDTATLSSGETIKAPKYLAAKLKRLARYQRSYSRGRDQQLVQLGLNPKKQIPKDTRIPVSNRMRRKRARIGTLHASITDARRDHLHQLSARIVAAAQVICLEDLDIRAMCRGLHRGFRRSVGDAGLSELRRQIEYKAAWSGRTVIRVDRWFPSSKTCAECGAINRALTLRDRIWICGCGAVHQRDLNAAINIEREGLRLLADSNTGPDGRTPRNGGSEARGEANALAGETSPDREASSMNRELIYRRKRGPSCSGGTDPPTREAG